MEVVFFLCYSVISVCLEEKLHRKWHKTKPSKHLWIWHILTISFVLCNDFNVATSGKFGLLRYFAFYRFKDICRSFCKKKTITWFTYTIILNYSAIWLLLATKFIGAIYENLRLLFVMPKAQFYSKQDRYFILIQNWLVFMTAFGISTKTNFSSPTRCNRSSLPEYFEANSSVMFWMIFHLSTKHPRSRETG